MKNRSTTILVCTMGLVVFHAFSNKAFATEKTYALGLDGTVKEVISEYEDGFHRIKRGTYTAPVGVTPGAYEANQVAVAIDRANPIEFKAAAGTIPDGSISYAFAGKALKITSKKGKVDVEFSTDAGASFGAFKKSADYMSANYVADMQAAIKELNSKFVILPSVMKDLRAKLEVPAVQAPREDVADFSDVEALMTQAVAKLKLSDALQRDKILALQEACVRREEQLAIKDARIVVLEAELAKVKLLCANVIAESQIAQSSTKTSVDKIGALVATSGIALPVATKAN